MILSLLFKNWRFILDAVIIVAVIVFIFLWNPFNIFGDGLKLHDTANIVSNVRSINQLVTAEYYGEVIASLTEAKIDLVHKNSLNDKAEKEYIKLKNDAYNKYDVFVSGVYSIEEIRKNDKEIKEAVKKAVKEYEELVINKKDELRDIAILFAAEKIFNRKIDLDDYKDDRDEILENELQFLFFYIKNRHSKLSTEEFYNFLNQGFETTSSFSDFYYNFKGKDIDDDKQLALIGRGWVKAGFDFGKLDDRRYVYDDKSKTIHMFGISPKILDSDINPWFIPEREVPGFDIILADNVNFEDAKKVKKYCIQKLEVNAINADILGKAKKYGEESIKELFTLLTGEEIRDVYFHSDELLTIEEQISKDSLITPNEILLIDSVYCKYKRELANPNIDNEVKKHKNYLLSQFIKDLKNLYLSGFEPAIKFNYFTKNISQLWQDSVITFNEFSVIKDSLRWIMCDDYPFMPNKYYLNRHWFDDSLEYINEYNYFVNSTKLLAGNSIYKLKGEKITNLKSGQPEYISKIEALKKNKGRKGEEIFNYKLNGDIIEFNRVENIEFVNYDTLKYVINITPQFIKNVVKSDSFYTKYNELNLTIDSCKVISLNQKNDITTYYQFIKCKNEEYQNKTWILKASETIKENFLNKKDYKRTGLSIREKVEDLRKYIIE